MRFLLFIICCLSSFHIYASEDIRYALQRDEKGSPIIYYYSSPDMGNFPILLLCEGSSNQGNVGSVLFIREYFAERVKALNVGYLTIEKWGVDGSQIDEIEFWNHYSRSQRLKDHLKVIDHFNKNPPEGWNGKFIFVGVSEGGPLVTDLSITCSNTLATINWVGAGDWNWADELWKFFESYMFGNPLPPTRDEYDALVQEIIRNPSSNQWLAGMTYFYHADAFTQTFRDYGKIKAPFLVVKGTEDTDIVSCDQFVQKAQTAGAPITYFKIEGMDHWLRKRPDVIDQSFEWLRVHLLNTKV